MGVNFGRDARRIARTGAHHDQIARELHAQKTRGAEKFRCVERRGDLANIGRVLGQHIPITLLARHLGGFELLEIARQRGLCHRVALGAQYLKKLFLTPDSGSPQDQAEHVQTFVATTHIFAWFVFLSKANIQLFDENGPILRGRDIKRYGYEWAELWVIAARLESDIPNKYPAICEHLKQYKGKGKLGDNSTTKVFQRPWWAWMQEPVNYWEDFDKPKVMWKIIGCNINFSFDFDGVLCNNAVNIMTGNEQQLLQFVGLMNSKLFDWYLKLTTEAEVQGGGIQLYVTTLEKTLLKLDFPDQLGALVNRRVKEEVADADIDAAIYELYALSLEEINYIDALRDS